MKLIQNICLTFLTGSIIVLSSCGAQKPSVIAAEKAYNAEKYFNEFNEVIKEIPAGEVVVTAYIKSFNDEVIVENVAASTEISNEEYLAIELVSRETIEPSSLIKDIVTGIEEYFIGLYNNIF